MNFENVGQNILGIRKLNRMTQKDLSEKTGIDNTTISQIEKGFRQLKVSEIGLFANAMGVDPTYIISYPDIYIKKETNNIEINSAGEGITPPTELTISTNQKKQDDMEVKDELILQMKGRISDLQKTIELLEKEPVGVREKINVRAANGG